MKVCTKCKVEQPYDNFHKSPHRRDGYNSWCKPCRVRSARGNHIKFKYGITLEEYDAMLAEQNGVCAICGQPEKRRNRSGGVSELSVDHDHTTGAVRSLLCDDCNNGIGRFHDREDLLNAAIDYLQQWEVRNA